MNGSGTSKGTGPASRFALVAVVPMVAFACRRTPNPSPLPATTVTADGGTGADASAPVTAPSSTAPDASTREEDGGPRLSRVLLEIPASATGSGAVTMTPVQPMALRRLPTHFEPSGRLLASCSQGRCGVWERKTGWYRGQVAESALSDWRRSGRSTSDRSPDGRYRVVLQDDGAVALINAAGKVLAKAKDPKHPCASAGAWKGDAPRVAIPCGRKLVALDAVTKAATWSKELTDDYSLTNDIVFGEDVAARASRVHDGATDEAMVSWSSLDGEIEIEEYSATQRGVSWAFDSVRGCLFQRIETCGCDCHESFATLHCPEEDGARVWPDPPAERDVSKDIVRGHDGLSYAYDTFGPSEHCVAHELRVVRIREGGADVWSAHDSCVLHGATFAPFDRGRGLVVVEHDGDGATLVIAREGAREMRDELGALSADVGLVNERLVLSGDGTAVAVVGREGAIVRALAQGAKPSAWASVRGLRFSPVSSLLAGEDVRTGRVQVRSARGAILFTSPADKPASLVGWAAKAEERDVLYLTVEGKSFEARFTKGAATLKARAAAPSPDEVAPEEAVVAPTNLRPASARDVERVTDGARVPVGEDRWYPRPASSASAWDDLTDQTRFRLGDDVLASPLVTRDQLDPMVMVPGLFARFVRGEPLPPRPEARAGLPPELRVSEDAGSFRARIIPSSGGFTYVEFALDGRTERVEAGEAPSLKELTLAPSSALRIRACGQLGPVCSPWREIPSP